MTPEEKRVRHFRRQEERLRRVMAEIVARRVAAAVEAERQRAWHRRLWRALFG